MVPHLLTHVKSCQTVRHLSKVFLAATLSGMTPGEAVRRRRLELGLTQRELAELAEVDRSAISNIERDQLPFGDRRAAKLARALETTPASLLPAEGPRATLGSILGHLQDTEARAERSRVALGKTLASIAAQLAHIESLLQPQDRADRG